MTSANSGATPPTIGRSSNGVNSLARLRADRRIVVRDAAAVALAELCHRTIGVDDANRRTIVRWAGRWWRWADGHHRGVEDEALRAEVWNVLCRVDLETDDEDDDRKINRTPLRVTTLLVNGVIDAMIALSDRVESAAELPCALPGYDGPAPSRIAVVRNGLLDLTTRTLYPPTPRFFATAGAAIDYDPDATCPNWERFLVEIFADEEDSVDDGAGRESIRLLRQIFGWLLSCDRTRHVIPLVIGPLRSGKSTAMVILRALLGEGNVCAPPLATLAESRFGLAPLLGKTAAIIPDARLGVKGDQAAVASLLLIVSGQDPVTIDRKGRDQIEARLRCRIVIVTNVLPRITDESGALGRRFLVVETRRSFIGREDLLLEDRLRTELPGVLRWAVEGWQDLVANGWVRPARTQEIVEELDRLGSPIRAFVTDCLIVGPGYEATLDDLYGAWRTWCTPTGRSPGTEEIFARDLRAAVPGVRSSRRRIETADRSDRRRLTFLGLGVQRRAS